MSKYFKYNFFFFIVEKQSIIMLEIGSKDQTVFFGRLFRLPKYNLILRISLDFHLHHIILSCT